MTTLSALSSALPSGRISFHLSAIMRHAHHKGRFAARMCRTAADRRAHLSYWLKRAWAAAKAEAASLRSQVEHAAAIRLRLAERARESVALAGHYGSAEAIRQAITSEQMRDRMNFAAVAKLEAALAAVSGARS